jgi:NADH-quinone oxidoreductase subunit M
MTHLLLVLTILVPLGGALMIAGMAEAGRHVVRTVALMTTLVALALAAALISQYEPPLASRPAPGPIQARQGEAPYAYDPGGAREDQFAVSQVSWLQAPESGLDLKFSLGLDGLSIWLFGLSALLMVTSVLVSWEAVRDRPRGFYASLLILEMGLLGVFAARDIILFYVFFEFTLVPLFFLIGIWGSEERRYAALKFFLFTFAGSALTFLGLLAIVLWHAGHLGSGAAWRGQIQPRLTFSIEELSRGMATRYTSADRFEALDRNPRDRFLSRVETFHVSDEAFNSSDANRDRRLTFREFAAAELGLAREADLFVALDRNGDLRLSADEAQPLSETRFLALDANEDGRLSPGEIKDGDAHLQWWIFLALFVGFAVKVPLFPLHTWLPLAHVQAPTAGSVLLAGVLLKIGSYGFVRFCLPMLPEATAECMTWVLWLSVVGIVYGALVALVQSDMKRLIAYSSVSHLGFCMVGIFALNKLGLAGGVLQMINHGLSTGALFAIVGMIYERYHTRKIASLGGLAARTPILAFFMLFFTFSSIGLPGLNGFAGEFLLLTGMFQRAWPAGPDRTQLLWIAVLSVSGVVLGAWYMLLLVQRTFFGPLREPAHEVGHAPVSDLRWTEIGALAPLAVFVIWIGIQPGYFLDRMNGTLDPLALRLERAAEVRAQSETETITTSNEP